MEGVKFGIYIGFLYSLVSAYGNYAAYPIPYSLAFQCFIFGLVLSVIFGIAVALIYITKLWQAKVFNMLSRLKSEGHI